MKKIFVMTAALVMLSSTAAMAECTIATVGQCSTPELVPYGTSLNGGDAAEILHVWIAGVNGLNGPQPSCVSKCCSICYDAGVGVPCEQTRDLGPATRDNKFSPWHC